MNGTLVFAYPGQLRALTGYSGDLILAHFISVYKKAIDTDQENLIQRRT
ncbi:hypothetical protein [Pantanalinema sp. GBBB05]